MAEKQVIGLRGIWVDDDSDKQFIGPHGIRTTAPSAAGTTYNVSAVDALSFSEASSETATFPETLAEALALADIATTTAELSRIIAESLSLTETAEGSTGIAVTIAESVLLTDTSSEIATFARTIIEAATFSDSAEIATKTIGKILLDTLTLSDTATAVGGVAQAAQKGGSSLTREQMRRLERLQLLRRDDEEVISLIMGLFK